MLQLYLHLQRLLRLLWVTLPLVGRVSLVTSGHRGIRLEIALPPVEAGSLDCKYAMNIILWLVYSKNGIWILTSACVFGWDSELTRLRMMCTGAHYSNPLCLDPPKTLDCPQYPNKPHTDKVNISSSLYSRWCCTNTTYIIDHHRYSVSASKILSQIAADARRVARPVIALRSCFFSCFFQKKNKKKTPAL